MLLPTRYSTDVLTFAQQEYIAVRLPQPQAGTGHPSYSNTVLLPGILKVLRSGCRWRDLNAPGYPSGVTHWRRLRFWQKSTGLQICWKELLRRLETLNQLRPTLVALDGTLVPSFAFDDTTSYSGKHHCTGTKLSIVVEAHGVPLAVVAAPGAAHDLPLAQPTLQQIPVSIQSRIQTLLADTAYDAASLRIFLREHGIVGHIPKRAWPHPAPPTPPQLSQRYIVERTNAWTKSFRRLRFRYDYTMCSFLGFVTLACVVMSVRKLIT